MLVLQSRDLLGLVLDRVSLSELPACGRVWYGASKRLQRMLLRELKHTWAPVSTSIDLAFGVIRIVPEQLLAFGRAHSSLTKCFSASNPT